MQHNDPTDEGSGDGNLRNLAAGIPQPTLDLLENLFTRQSREITAHFERRLAEVQQQRDQATSTPPSTQAESSEALVRPAQEPQPKRKAFPWPPKFEGERTQFPAWKALMSHKLDADAAMIGTQKDGWFAVYSYLGDGPKALASNYFLSGGTNKAYDPKDLLEYLANKYIDRNN
jgi:hypothetical protein